MAGSSALEAPLALQPWRAPSLSVQGFVRGSGPSLCESVRGSWGLSGVQAIRGSTGLLLDLSGQGFFSGFMLSGLSGRLCPSLSRAAASRPGCPVACWWACPGRVRAVRGRLCPRLSGAGTCWWAVHWVITGTIIATLIRPCTANKDSKHSPPGAVPLMTR